MKSNWTWVPRQKSSQILFREWFRARENKNDVASLLFFSSLRVRPRDGLCYLHFSTLTCFLGPDMTTIKHSEEFWFYGRQSQRWDDFEFKFKLLRFFSSGARCAVRAGVVLVVVAVLLPSIIKDLTKSSSQVFCLIDDYNLLLTKAKTAFFSHWKIAHNCK